MQRFEYYSPTRIVFGSGAENHTAEAIQREKGRRILMVYGAGSAVKSGLVDRIKRDLNDAHKEVFDLAGVRANPTLAFARQGVAYAIENKVDFILAVGGGSAIDTAKAIAIGAANPQTDLWDIWTRRVQAQGALPHGVVLTIAAAGSETSESAVLTNEDVGVKRGFSCDFNRPRFAIMNPELTYTLPSYQRACGIVDIMMHTLDRYFTPTRGNETTDELAEALLRVILRNGRSAMEDPTDYQAASEVMWCGSLSHNGLTGLGADTDFAPHQLGHELSAMFDATHGASLSAIWGSWARYCCPADSSRFARYARQVWGIGQERDDDAALEGIAQTERYFESIGMPTGFSALGIGLLEDKTLHELADRCTWHGKRTIGSFRTLDTGDVICIYRQANH